MQAAAALLKREIEAKLVNHIPAALSPRMQQAARLFSTGEDAIDALLGGGLPLGSVCEFTGADGSGRSSLALSLLAQASLEAPCAYIDTDDALSPHCAAAAGVALGNLLWIRLAASGKLLPTAGSDPSHASETACERQQGAGQNGGHPHSRAETHDLTPALENMLRQRQERHARKTEGTHGHPNRPLGLAAASEEQIAWERFNLRTPDAADPLRIRNQAAADAARKRARLPAAVRPTRPERGSWDRLGAALRATDQVLQSGGFRLVVLDLASTAPEQALRIPAASWFRFRRAAEESDAILLLLTRVPCARSSAGCVLECTAVGTIVQGVLASRAQEVAVARQRTGAADGKKMPGRAAHWQAAPAWMRGAGSR